MKLHRKPHKFGPWLYADRFGVQVRTCTLREKCGCMEACCYGTRKAFEVVKSKGQRNG